MEKVLSGIQQVKAILETAAFQISTADVKETHSKILESMMILSQLEANIQVKVAPKEYADEAVYEVKKVQGRLQRWFRNPTQYNSQILLNYLRLAEQKENITPDDLRKACAEVYSFHSNYAQMKNFGTKNHGKVFEEIDGYVTLWEPVRDRIRELYADYR